MKKIAGVVMAERFFVCLSFFCVGGGGELCGFIFLSPNLLFYLFSHSVQAFDRYIEFGAGRSFFFYRQTFYLISCFNLGQ